MHNIHRNLRRQQPNPTPYQRLNASQPLDVLVTCLVVHLHNIVREKHTLIMFIESNSI